MRTKNQKKKKVLIIEGTDFLQQQYPIELKTDCIMSEHNRMSDISSVKVSFENYTFESSVYENLKARSKYKRNLKYRQRY